MATLTAYEASPVDWDGLRALAGDAARRTTLKPAPQLGYVRRGGGYVEALGPHWALDHRQHHHEAAEAVVINEQHQDHVYALLASGDLVVVVVIEETMHSLSGGSRVGSNDHHTVRAMTDDVIGNSLSLDLWIS